MRDGGRRGLRHDVLEHHRLRALGQVQHPVRHPARLRWQRLDVPVQEGDGEGNVKRRLVGLPRCGWTALVQIHLEAAGALDVWRQPVE